MKSDFSVLVSTATDLIVWSGTCFFIPDVCVYLSTSANNSSTMVKPYCATCDLKSSLLCEVLILPINTSQ